ncbi:MAG: transposase [Actinobacteria bacterium]|nr:transposase [Actinomycetota bacterium]
MLVDKSEPPPDRRSRLWPAGMGCGREDLVGAAQLLVLAFPPALAGELTATASPPPKRKRSGISSAHASTSKTTVGAPSSALRAFFCVTGVAFPAGRAAGSSASMNGCAASASTTPPPSSPSATTSRPETRAPPTSRRSTRSSTGRLTSPRSPTRWRMRCLRGIGTLSAAIIQAEVCDFRRFATASAFMAFTGLVPSEHSSGDKEYRGSITKSGNHHRAG